MRKAQLGRRPRLGTHPAISTAHSTEKPEYELVCALLRQCLCGVYRLAQARASNQTPGVPDLIAFSPLRGLAFVEVKRPDGRGRQSLPQREFAAYCADAGATYLLGGVAEVRDWLAGRSCAAGDVRVSWPRA